ncbi:MAG: CmpA/NrtA family ABC transporter substrate-binding protein [Terrimicrobiaceae bacterium]
MRGRRAAPAVIARRRTLRLGFVPLADAAPLLVARSAGMFERHGLDVRLEGELGWGTIREKIARGELDASHALGGLVFSLVVGTHTRPCNVRAEAMLSFEGNAITLSRRLWRKGVRDGQSLRLLLRAESPRRPVFAVVSTVSSHHMLLRGWLQKSGMDPDRDVRIVVLPPPLVCEHMREAHIDGFCAGEPWNTAAVQDGEGWVVATSRTLDAGHPEKVLLLSESFAGRDPDAAHALRLALWEACQWCDDPENRESLPALFKEADWFGLPDEVVRRALTGPFDRGYPAAREESLLMFSDGCGNRSSRQRAWWFLNGIAELNNLPMSNSQRAKCVEAFADSSI